MKYYDQLLDFLNAHRFLVLPGVGTIVVTRTNSRFSKNRTILTAPKFHLELLEVDTNRFQQQISILAKSWDIEDQKVGEVLEEFVPIIPLKRMGAQELMNRCHGNANGVNETAKSQLRSYLTNIASMYQDNPFHNFEHASHVVSSVKKLLKRIVNVD